MIKAQVTNRSRFVRRVGDAFDEAKIDHVFLHDFEASTRDSDIDIAVARQSLAAVDLLLRSGRFGRLVQRFDHDVPWSRYYVVVVNEPGRRYRQLDIASDPWGISKDGPSIRLALDCRHRVNGLSVPTPAAEAVYLVVKRARKGTSPDEANRMRQAFLADSLEATRILELEFGHVGLNIASAIETGGDLEGALLDLSEALGRLRRSPVSRVRRVQHETRRIVHRFAQPSGLVVGLAGPDGAGKTSLAAALERESIGLFRSVKRLHLRPGLLPPPSRLLGRIPDGTSDPHAKPPSGSAGSSARVAYLVLDTVAGWPTRVWLPRVHSSLITLERGLVDLTVDPRRYRLRCAPRIVERLAPVLPQAEITLVLDAPPAVIHKRKPELAVPEIERQLAEWRARATSAGASFRVLDAGRSERSVVAHSLDAIDDILAARQGRLDIASVALECLGGVSTGGAPYRILSVRKQPRWLLPAGLGPLSSGLYRPASRRHHSAAFVLELGARMSRQAYVDSRNGLAPVIAARLGVNEIELAAAIPRERERAERVLLSAFADGRLVAWAKVSQHVSELRHEAGVLSALRSGPLEHLVTPEILDLFNWNDFSVMLLRPHPTPGYADRKMDSSEVAALIELAGLSERLAPIIGSSPHLLPVHGDFTGWNSASLPSTRLALWDWEEARLGLPLEDLFHWRIQRLVRFGKGTVTEIARGAEEPDASVLALCDALGLDSATAPIHALLACASQTFTAQDQSNAGERAAWVNRALLTRLRDV